MPRRKLIFIAGLSRVGSTLLDMLLGTNENHIGLGEIYSGVILQSGILDLQVNINCSCGETVDSCPFWSGVRKKVHSLPENASLRDKYLLVVDHFYETYGDDTVLIDSSKDIEALKTVMSVGDIEVKVIYLIRDVRSWVTARIDTRKRNEQYYVGGGYLQRISTKYNNRIFLFFFAQLAPYLTRMPAYYFLIWYYQNRQLLRYITANGISHILVGYEEACLYTDMIMEKLYNYLGIQTDNYPVSSGSSKSHVIFGNVKKFDKSLKKGIFYDDAWLQRREWRLSYTVLFIIAIFNRKYVYSNCREDPFSQASN